MFMTNEYKYNNVYTPNTTHNNQFKTIWYITDADLKQYRCSYGDSSAYMVRILASKEPVKFFVYRIMINTHEHNHDIFFRIFHRKNQNSKWIQITHRSMLGDSYSNHAAIKYNGAYAWKISKEDAVYLLDSRANEANASWKYDKTKHSKYYGVVINKFVIYLYDSINTLYSPYEVLKTLNVIYELFTDEKQLNWSPFLDVPVQSFILSLQSRITSKKCPKKTNYSELISLFATLCYDKLSTTYNQFLCDDKLTRIYNQFRTDGKLLDLLPILLNDDKKLINRIKYMLLLQRKRNLNPSYRKSYYFLLWYNLICTCTGNVTHVSHEPLIQAWNKQIANSQLNLEDLLFVIASDQRVSCSKKKEFLLTDILMTKVIEYLKKTNSLQARQKTFFALIDIMRNTNDLYAILKKYKTFVFGCVLIQTDCRCWLQFLEKIRNKHHHQLKLFAFNEFCSQISVQQNVNGLSSRHKILFAFIDIMTNTNDLYAVLKKYKTFVFGSVIIETKWRIWLQFVRCLFRKLRNKYDDQLILLVLNELCAPIRQISVPQKSNELFTLYNEWKKFMNCSLIQNTILQNEFLISQKRFIIICSAKLRKLDKLRFKDYLYLWANVFPSNKLVEIFDTNGFNSKVLTDHLAQSVETERKNNIKINGLYERYKQQNEILIAANKSLNAKTTQQKIALTKSNKEQQKRINEFENKLNQFRENNKTLKELQQTQQQTISQLNNKLKTYENKMNEFKENNVRLNDECKELNFELTEMTSKYDKLYQIHNIKKYKNWNYANITDWIISLNEEHQIYENVLRTKLKEEELTGLYLCDLKNDDLDRFGIKAFKHKTLIMNEIKKLHLVNKNYNHNNGHLDNDKIEAEGCENITKYIEK